MASNNYPLMSDDTAPTPTIVGPRMLPNATPAANFNAPMVSTAPNPYTNPRPNPYRIAGTPEYARMHPLKSNATVSPSISSAPSSPGFSGPTSGASTAWPTGEAPQVTGPVARARPGLYGPTVAVSPAAPGTNTLGPNSTYNDQNSYAGGLNKIDAANRIASGPLPTINRIGDSKNPITDQQARTMYGSIQGTYPTLAREDQDEMFHQQMKQYGLDGHAMLNGWRQHDGGQVQTSFQTGTKTTPAVPGTLLSSLGPDRAGGTPAPGMFAASGGVNSPRIGGSPAITTPVMGPQPGMTVRPEYLTAPGMTSNVGPAPVDDATRARVRDTQASSLRNQGEAAIAYTHPGAREQFNAGVDVAGRAADAAARGKDNGTPPVRAADRATFFKNLSGERTSDGRGGTRKLTVDEKMALTDRFFGASSAPANPPAGGGGAPTTQPSADAPSPTTQPSTFAGGDGSAPITPQNASAQSTGLQDDEVEMLRPDGSRVAVKKNAVRSKIPLGYRLVGTL